MAQNLGLLVLVLGYFGVRRVACFGLPGLGSRSGPTLGWEVVLRNPKVGRVAGALGSNCRMTVYSQTS